MWRTITTMLIIGMLAASTGAVRINEIMYNPEGADDNREFVEVYGTDNLSGYITGDKFENDSLTPLKHKAGNYSLIVEEGFNHSKVNASVYSAGATIGNGLANGGDTVYLYLNGTAVDTASYEGSIADGNGYSLEYHNGTFLESLVEKGTPGRVNSHELASNPTDNSINQTKNTTINQTTSATENNTETNTTNSTINVTESDSCNVTLGLEIINKKQVYESGDTLKYSHVLSNESFEFKIEYWITGLYGEEVRRKRETSNLDEKQFTPSVTGQPEQAFIIHNRLAEVDCNNTASRTSNTEVVVVRGEDENACEEKTVCREHIQKASQLRRELEERPESSGGGGGGGFYIPEEEGEIRSFYTRKRKFDPVIRLFTGVEGDGLYRLTLTSATGEENKTIITNSSETFEFKAKASQGRNLYVLEMFDTNEERIDMEKLVVHFPEEKEEEVHSKPQTARESRPEPQPVATIEEKKPVPAATTGKVVYDNGEDVSGFLIAGSLLLAAVLGMAAVWNIYNEEIIGWLQSNFYKSRRFSPGHGRGRDRGEDRRGRIHPGERNIRGSGQPEGARRGIPPGLHGEPEDRL